jgi:hypothetical protein
MNACTPIYALQELESSKSSKIAGVCQEVCIGFVGPMLVAAGGNQGPMVGLFITGPTGTIVGAIGGFSYARWRRNKV